MVYLNTANNELKITPNTASTKQRATESFSLKLLNQKGKTLKQAKTTVNGKNIVLQVANVPKDIYYVHIYEGKKVSKQQVVIAH